MSFNNRLKQLIEEKGVTPYVVASKTGIAQSSISRILSGKTTKTSIRNTELLAKYFNVSPQWLLTGTGQMLNEGVSVKYGIR